MEKNPGGQKFWQRGEGRFREILSCPPPKCVLPLKCPPKFRDLALPLPAHVFFVMVRDQKDKLSMFVEERRSLLDLLVWFGVSEDSY